MAVLRSLGFLFCWVAAIVILGWWFIHDRLDQRARDQAEQDDLERMWRL